MLEVDPDLEFIDLTERLAPYEGTQPRPGWREHLIAEDMKRRQRRPKADQWGFKR
jgi:hypothetical protein